MTNALLEKPTAEETKVHRFEEFRLREGRVEVLRDDDTVSEVYDLTEWSLGCPTAERPLGKALFFGIPTAMLLGCAYAVGTWWGWAILGLIALPFALLTLVCLSVRTYLVLESNGGETARLLIGDVGIDFILFGAEIAGATRRARGLPEDDDDED